jgi:hypothetical protein
VKLRLQPTPVAAIDAEGLLVFSDLGLVAVLVRLSELHEEKAGQWFLEAGFGELDRHQCRMFPDLDAAQDWIADHLKITRTAT